MTEEKPGHFQSGPEAVFYLVSNRDSAEELSTEKQESLDDQPGVQATLDLEDLGNSTVFDRVLKEAKVGSRWGKDLSVVYQDYLRTRVDQVDEAVLADELEAQFNRYDADPYESAVLGDAMTIGINLSDQIQQELEGWTQQEFTRDDLAAALGISARSENFGKQNTYGGLIFRSTEPLSKIKDQHSFLRASQNLQQLILMGFDIALIAPVGGPDEEEVIETTFRGVGSFSVKSIAGVQFDVSDDTAAAVDEWYDRLRYDVADNRVVKNVVRPASVTAYDLPNETWAQHFKNAITTGLQGAYSEKAFNKDRFDELWKDQISSHANYDQYRSRRATFPDVKVTRESDGESRVFNLHHEGPSATPYICELPTQTLNPEKELIDWIERFLTADRVTEQHWQELVESFDKLSQTLDSTPETLIKNALLHRHRQRQSLSPLLPPSVGSEKPSRNRTHNGAYDNEWYEEHWPTILSNYVITKQGGVGAIERKQELQQTLNPEQEADVALFHKLERDINNAWEYFVDGVTENLKQSLTVDQHLTIEHRETQSAQEIEVNVAPESGNEQTVTIEILVPYSEVYVDDTKVRTATITNTVSDVIDNLGSTMGTQYQNLSHTAKPDILYDLTRLYLDVAEFEEGDLIYFDDIISFSLSLPNVQKLFETPQKDVEDEIRDVLGDEVYINRLREKTKKFHRKGSDQHGSVKVDGDRYIAMELQEAWE